MEIVSITVCVDYSDYFCRVIERNASVLDHMYVVTRKTDTATQELCQRFQNITMVFYEDLNLKAAFFNKSGMIRFAQMQAYKMYPDAWYLILDADIMLPCDFREIVQTNCDDQNALYGMSRYDYKCQVDLEEQKNGKHYPHNFVGYFQLYREKKMYDSFSLDCSRCDDLFKCGFKTKVNLPGSVSHLGEKNVNWRGRKSKLWE